MISRAFAKHLGANVDGLTYSETELANVFVEHMPSEPDSPDVAVAVMTGAAEPQLSRIALDMPGVQVLIRGARFVPDDTMARTVYSEMCCLDGVMLDDGGPDEVWLIGCTPAQSHPIALGRDPDGRYEWSVNFRLRVTAPTAHR